MEKQITSEQNEGFFLCGVTNSVESAVVNSMSSFPVVWSDEKNRVNLEEGLLVLL